LFWEAQSYLVKPVALVNLLAVLLALLKIAATFGLDVPASLLGGALINLHLLRVLHLQLVLYDYDIFRKFVLALGFQPLDTCPWQLQLA
jgi:hypothetical protein